MFFIKSKKFNIKNSIKNKKGFSLFETVVYIALFSMISVIILLSISISAKIYRTAKVNNLMTESGNSAMERITRSARSANTLTANSIFNSASGVLETLNTDGTTAKIYISNGIVLLDENGVLSGNLTNEDLVASSLYFYNITTPQGVAVKTELTLTHSETNRTEKFQSTTILRNAY